MSQERKSIFSIKIDANKYLEMNADTIKEKLKNFAVSSCCTVLEALFYYVH